MDGDLEKATRYFEARAYMGFHINGCLVHIAGGKLDLFQM